MSTIALARPKSRRTSPAERAPSPAPGITFLDVESIPDVYAMKLLGDCLEPELMDGDEVQFSKHDPVEAGDFAIFILRPELVKPGQCQSMIKRVVMGLPPHVRLPYREHPESEVHAAVMAEQLNPARTFTMMAADLLALHKFVGIQRRAVRS